MIKGNEDVGGQDYKGAIWVGSFKPDGDFNNLKGMPRKCKSVRINCATLESLEGGPEEVEDVFALRAPNLKSLKGAPKKCKEFSINGADKLVDFKGLENSKISELNVITNYKKAISSLKGLPSKVEKLNIGTIAHSLEGLPREVSGECRLSLDSTIDSLKGMPAVVGSLELYFEGNFKNLQGFPKVVKTDCTFEWSDGSIQSFEGMCKIPGTLRIGKLDGAYTPNAATLPEYGKLETDDPRIKKDLKDRDKKEEYSFMLYNPEFGSWEEGYVSIYFSTKHKGFIWDNEVEMSSKGYPTIPEAFKEFKVFLKQNGLKFKDFEKS